MITLTDYALKHIINSHLDVELVKEVISSLFMFTKNDMILLDYERNLLKIFRYEFGEIKLHSSLVFEPSFVTYCIKYVYKDNKNLN